MNMEMAGWFVAGLLYGFGLPVAYALFGVLAAQEEVRDDSLLLATLIATVLWPVAGLWAIARMATR